MRHTVEVTMGDKQTGAQIEGAPLDEQPMIKKRLNKRAAKHGSLPMYGAAYREDAALGQLNRRKAGQSFAAAGGRRGAGISL